MNLCVGAGWIDGAREGGRGGGRCSSVRTAEHKQKLSEWKKVERRKSLGSSVTTWAIHLRGVNVVYIDRSIGRLPLLFFRSKVMIKHGTPVLVFVSNLRRSSTLNLFLRFFTTRYTV